LPRQHDDAVRRRQEDVRADRQGAGVGERALHRDGCVLRLGASRPLRTRKSERGISDSDAEKTALILSWRAQRACRRTQVVDAASANQKPPRETRAALRRNGIRGLVALALHALAEELAVAADGLGLLAGAALARLLVVAAQLHLAEHALALQLLLERAQRLVDVVVADEDLHEPAPLAPGKKRPAAKIAASKPTTYHSGGLL